MTSEGGIEGSVAKFGRFIEQFLASDLIHRVRGSVLESAISLEFAVNEALAV
jgi:hypothetical protein